MAKGTVLVNLKRDWFSPDGSRYQVRRNPHEFPAAWADAPEKEELEKDPKRKYAVLPSTAEVIEGGKTVITNRLSANGTPIPEATVVDDDVKSVGNTVEDAGPKAYDATHQSTPVATAVKVAKEEGVQVGGKPKESGPLAKA